MAPASMKLVNLAKLDQPHRLHASATLRAHHDMIVDGNTHVSPRFDQLLRHPYVLTARRRVARRMVVNDDDRRSA